jgi:hypothetical protein
MKTTVKYGFREVYTDEETDAKHFVFPHANPHEHENAIDYMFDTPEAAIEFLNDNDLADEAVDNKWLLVKETTEVIQVIDV